MKTIYFFLAGILLVTFASCKKTNDTYSLKGRMMKDCSGTPLASYSVRLWYKAPSSLYKSKDLGTTITDADGNFTIDSIPFGHRGGLYLIGEEGNTWYSNFEVPVANPGDVYDLGNFYGTSEDNTVFKLSVDTSNFNGADTLYIGPDHYNYKTLTPIPSYVVLAFSFTNTLGKAESPAPFPIRWSTRKSHYDSLTSPNTPADKDQHAFSVPAALCSYPDTSIKSIH